MKRVPVLPPSARHVGKLRLRAGAEEDARRAATLLTDALHTASLPLADSGQMLVVRRLALGRISTRASPAALALRVEAVLREARWAAVPFDRPGAQGSNAVLFPSRTEAIAALAGRHARGPAAGEWFWAKAVPAWTGGRSRGEGWLSLLEAAYTLPEAVLAAAAVAREAVRAGLEDELLCAVPPGRGADWLQAGGWETAGPASDEPGTGLPLGVRHEEILHRWRGRWGTAAERLRWLATLLAVIEQPSRAADPRLPARVAAATRERAAGQRPAAETAAPATAEPPCAKPAPPGRPHPAAAGLDPGGRPDADDPPRPTAGDGGQEPTTTGQARDIRSPGEWTDGAGLLFLIAILERLGFTEFLAAHPVLLDGGFPVRWLRFAGEHAGLRPDDPLCTALGEPPAAGAPPLAAWELPDAARHLLARRPPRVPPESPALAWLTAVRRWCRRRGRIGLATLIRRRGRVRWSQTHLDLCFPLAAADVRVRRLALDTDPAWVPWLGRVVRFHYLDSHEFDH